MVVVEEAELTVDTTEVDLPDGRDVSEGPFRGRESALDPPPDKIEKGLPWRSFHQGHLVGLDEFSARESVEIDSARQG